MFELINVVIVNLIRKVLVPDDSVRSVDWYR